MKREKRFKHQNQIYSKYKELNQNKYYIFKVYDLIRKLNKTYKFKNFLDVGCADGSFSKKLKDDFDFDAHGIDISGGAIKLALKKGIKATVHNLEHKLHFEDNFFDLIFCLEVIEHIYDTDFLIRELKRVLKNKGILIISTPNLASLLNRVKIILGKYPSFVPEFNIQAGHIRAYTVPILSKQLEKHSLEILIKTSPNITFPMTNPKIPRKFKKIATKLGDFFPTLGSHMIIVARK